MSKRPDRYPDDMGGIWLRPPKGKPFKMMCCDCALVHNLSFRVVKGRAEFKVSRNQRSTGQARRQQGIVLKYRSGETRPAGEAKP